MDEIWKDIEGYEGLYQVSNLGRVRSLDKYRNGRNGAQVFCKGKILKPFKEKSVHTSAGSNCIYPKSLKQKRG